MSSNYLLKFFYLLILLEKKLYFVTELCICDFSTHRDIPVNTEVDFWYDIECEQDKYGDHKKPWRHSNKEEEIHTWLACYDIYISSYGKRQHQRELYRFK